jgi:predicted  nucleic acid-binding Zn-ribbon protein
LELESRVNEIQNQNLASLQSVEEQIAKYRGAMEKQLENARRDMDTSLANIKVELQEINQSAKTASSKRLRLTSAPFRRP